MKHYHNSGLPGNGKSLPVSSLPLFKWAEGQPAPRANAVSLAERFLAHRRHMSPHIARLVAEHAGFNLEACE